MHVGRERGMDGRRRRTKRKKEWGLNGCDICVHYRGERTLWPGWIDIGRH